MFEGILKVEKGDVVGTINTLLKGVLESKKVDALLVPQEVPSGAMAFDVLVADAERLKSNIFAPVLPTSTATLVSRITKFRGTDKIIGVVMRPCQIRALVELVKLNQASLENVVIIGVDCLGTFPAKAYGDFSEGGSPTEFILDSFMKQDGGSEKHLRSSCKICKDPIPGNADCTIGLYGSDIKKELTIQAHTEAGNRLLEGSGIQKSRGSKTRAKAVEAVRKEKARNRADFIGDNQHLKGIEALGGFFDKCTKCHNCMTACPICYCRECIFESSVFDLEADRYVNKAEARGLMKMPNDSVLFHVTRMCHMVLSCVGCGLCEQACPNDIPLMSMITEIAKNAQEELNYTPGENVDDPVPMVVYKEDEFSEIGGK